ncbi:four-carbon acid sugar kinase family protein [Chamaesiphon polymorphus]|uniref:Hrp-dependent type III effector protein n=1 Tax=Chamaesiphon polymorphus CCALA 037 TaxID=2107692 RepID=A0A2T1GB47_9CYAN|nr:four-carbon acid sugar kinase family protein [Chamaesiphon polymorphus]PSB54473.1 Hrp-dependent type III effector protein [Chamaesiphon polymorphus CCALA 037]
MTDRSKIIVLDDDPTGSQTVHSCLLLTQWDVPTLKLGLADTVPIFFILTNTRALAPDRAAAVTTEVCQNLKVALAETQIDDFIIVSRSDSTLRGHYPIETDVIAAELGGFDAHFLMPAFFEGGRITRDSIHYLLVDGVETPVHKTEFARDSVFAFSHSYLPDYVAEKTQGQIPADRVVQFLLAEVRSGSLDRLMQLERNRCCVVDGERQADFDRFAADILTAVSQGKKFLFRSGASILTSLANLGPQPIPATDMSTYVRDGKSGAIIVGSHVQKTTDQLAKLLEAPGIVGVEIDISQLVGDNASIRAGLLASIRDRIDNIHATGDTPAIYTSRQELTFNSIQTRLQFGEAVSALLMDIIRSLPHDIGFLISKGGITSNDTLSKGLALSTARSIGQILPGCSAIVTSTNHPQFPNLPVVLFPGNVGDADALATAYLRLVGS